MTHLRIASLLVAVALFVPRLAFAADTEIAGAAPVRVAGDDRAVNFELEANYQYSETEAKMTGNLDLGSGSSQRQRDSRVLESDNFGGALRVVGPKFGDIARPFIQLRGVSNIGDDQITAARSGQLGMTGRVSAQLEQDYGIHLGAGLAVPMRVGPVVITFKPYAGYDWDQYTARVIADERALGFPNQRQAKDDFTVGSIEVGGQLDVQPWYACGVYLFGGVGWRMPVYNDSQKVSVLTPGGFPASGKVELQNSAVVNAGIGYKF